MQHWLYSIFMVPSDSASYSCDRVELYVTPGVSVASSPCSTAVGCIPWGYCWLVLLCCGKTLCTPLLHLYHVNQCRLVVIITKCMENMYMWQSRLDCEHYNLQKVDYEKVFSVSAASHTMYGAHNCSSFCVQHIQCWIAVHLRPVQRAMGDEGFATGTDSSCGWSFVKECRFQVWALSLVLFPLSPSFWALDSRIITAYSMPGINQEQ